MCGQLVDGSTAPDFTFSDINGNTQNLYSILNQGKYVAIDISATWCGPCWTYHNQNVIDSLYEKHDLPGDNTWRVLFIEADPNTSSADLQGTGGNTQGNWVQGSNYIIIDPPAGGALNGFKTNYNINFYPTLYLICPDKKVIQDVLNTGPRPLVDKWESVANNMCTATGIDNFADNNPVTIYPNPANSFTTLYFALQNAAKVILTIRNITGQVIATKNYDNLSGGDQSLKYDVRDLQPGVYFLTISASNRSVVKKLLIQ